MLVISGGGDQLLNVISAKSDLILEQIVYFRHLLKHKSMGPHYHL